MATEYSGSAGGKFRKKPSRRTQSTPYDKPLTALRPTQLLGGGGERENNSWLSKLVDPASRLITAGAHKLFSSVFRKRLLPPPQPQHSPDKMMEIGDVQPEMTSKVGPSGTKEFVVSKGNDQSRVSESGGVADLEDIMKQKTFTRSEIDHLTTLLLSRTVDGLVGDKKERSEHNLSANYTATHTAIENGAEKVKFAAISTPAGRSKVLEDVVASPAELAKAYMGSRPTRASPSVQHEQQREDLSAPHNPFFKPKSPAMSPIQKPASVIGASTNGFLTPRFRGRSAIYSMARTPYSRPHPTEVKATETASDVHGVSLSHNSVETQQLSGSKRQVLKRRSSVLESDIGLVGPIRRIRQKPNLLHHKALSLPASGAPHVKHGSGASTDVTEVPFSINWSSNDCSSKVLVDNGKPSTSNGYVPSQSIETAQKIFQELDKFSSKGKSPEKKFDIVEGSSSGKLTTDMRDGLARKSLNSESLKVLQTIQDRKMNGLVDSSNGHDHSLTTSPKVEEASIKKFVIPSVEHGAEAGSLNKVMDIMNPRSGFDHQQKKRAFQMSAHEDYLELDDDVHTNGVMSTPTIDGGEGHMLTKSSAAFFDNSPQSEAIFSGKPMSPKSKQSTYSLGSKEKSLPDKSATAQQITGYAFPMGLSTSSTTCMSTQALVSSLSAADMNEVAGQSVKSNEINTFSSNSSNVVPFSFSSSPSIVESTGAKDIKSELRSSSTIAENKVDGSDLTDKKSTLHSVDVSKKMEGVPSPVVSSANGFFSFGLQSNGSGISNGSPSTVSATIGVSSPVQFSISSNDQSPVPVSVSSSPLLSTSNGNAVSSTSTLATSGTVIKAATTGAMATFGSSSTFSTSTAPSVSFGSTFQFGSPAVPSTSAIATSALESVANSGAKSSDGLFSTKATETASSGNNVSGLNASTLTSAKSETQSTPAFSFGSQASTSAVTTSTQIFSSQPASAASSFVFGFSAPASTSFSTGANPFTPGSGSATNVFGSSSVTAPVNSSSKTASNIFGSQTSGSTFGTSSQSNVFTFGLSASGTSAGSSSTPLVFGAASSSSAAGNVTPIVFGANSSAANSAPFAFGAASTAPVFSIPSAAASTHSLSMPFSSQSAFGSSSSQPFPFGSTLPAGNNDRMSMEDSMAEDSVQVTTPTASVFTQQISVPSSNFAFGGAAPATGNTFQFAGQQNQFASQNTPFQPSGPLDFKAGGSFSLGNSSGAPDKSNRKYVKVKKGLRRK